MLKVNSIKKLRFTPIVKLVCLVFCFFLSPTVFGLKKTIRSGKFITYPKVSTSDSVQKISVQAVTEITYQATTVVQTLESVLNSITFNDNTSSELAGYINNSYTPNQRSRVFLNNTVIVESDLDPKFTLGINKDVTADKYLNDLDLAYEKTADFSIKFSNIVVSDVKKKAYYYVNVKYQSDFGSKYKPDGGVYPKRERVAEIRLEPIGKKHWNAFITGIRFYDPKYQIDSKENDLAVVSSDSTAVASAVSDLDVKNLMSVAVKSKVDENTKNQDQCNLLIKNGDVFLNDKKYQEALDAFKKAQSLVPLSPPLIKRIIKTRKLIFFTNRFGKTPS